MKYKIPTNLTYELLSNFHIDGWVRCGGIPCSDCILSIQDAAAIDSFRCTLDRESIPSTAILNRLVKYTVLTKAEALDLLIMER